MVWSLFSVDTKSSLRLRWLAVVILVAIIAVIAVPQYLSGQWPWQSPPEVAQIRIIRDLKETGLAIDGWSEDFQQKLSIGGGQWSVQQLSDTESSSLAQMVLFLKPQGQSDNQPQVEWVDLNGAQKWQTSDYQRLRRGTLTINTFRAWTSNQTFAVAQWYATPQSGHPAPSHWFWRDQKYQWTRGERLPWVAACLLLPMPPLEDVSLFYPELERLSQLVQTTLGETVFAPAP